MFYPHYDYKFTIGINKIKTESIKKFRINNHCLYYKNYSREIEDIRGEYEWNALTEAFIYKMELNGYNEYIWDNYKWPVKNVIDTLYTLYKEKHNKYWFTIYIEKCIYKKKIYEESITWIQMKHLTDSKRAILKSNKLLFIKLPIDIFYEIITFINIVNKHQR